MGEVCETCGLPDELCVCTDMSKSVTAVSIDVDERRYGKKMTIIAGFDETGDIGDLASELKSQLGCGGTIDDNEIHLQGDHREDVRELLTDRGYRIT